MLIKSHRQLITHSALFQNLTTDECQALLDTGRCHQVLAQTFPFHAGELAHTFYILISGSVRLVQATASGKQVILHYISPGRYFGVSVALSGMHYGVSAETIENSILYCWNADSVRQLMAQYPRLALNAIDLLARRHQHLQIRFREMATEGVEKRVVHALIYLANYVGKPEGETILINLPLSRQDLAEMTGTNLYNVSRFLRKWEKANLVQIGRKQVRICDHVGLIALTQNN